MEIQVNNDGNVKINMALTMRMNTIFVSDIDNCFVMAILNERGFV